MDIKITTKQYFDIILTEKNNSLISENNDLCKKKLLRILDKRDTVLIFQSAIDKVLQGHKKNWREFNDVEKYIKMLKLIGKTDEEIDLLLNMNFVYDESGNWDRINKLNTNYSDLANLVVDVLESEGKDLCQIFKNIESGDKSDLKMLSEKIKSNPEEFYEKYLKSNKEKYVQNNIKNTEAGNQMEQIVIDFLKTKEWKLLYQAVEGSPIDTKLGIDIIMESPNGKIAKIQVKKVWTLEKVERTPCEMQGKVFTNKKQGGGFLVSTRGVYIRPKDINLVAYATESGDVLILRKYSPVTVKGNTCVDIPIYDFPSNPRGSFFVDHESVVFSKV